MKEVTPGIYQIQLPIPNPYLKYVNIYLVQGNSGHLLIDTGWNIDEAFDSLKKQLAEIGISFKDITQIVITHFHPDHYGLSGRLKRLSRAKVALHNLEKDIVDSRYINMDDLLRQMERWLHSNGVPTDEMRELQRASLGMAKFVTPASPDITLLGGETIATDSFNFKVIWTPGHSPGHICLYEPAQKVLISGDNILPTITPHVGRHPQSGTDPLGDYIDSLNMLKKLDVNLILPGHENPFTGLKPRIEELLRHHKRRNREILAAIRAEAKTAYQIAAEMDWIPDVSELGWQDLTPLDKRLAVLETIAHLESMRINGKVDKFSRDSLIYYQLN